MRSDLDLNAFVAGAGDAIVGCDADGSISLWNAAAERLFGYAADEALGRSLDLIVPQRLRERHWDGYRRTMASGVTRYGHDVLRVPGVDKHGRALSIAFTVTMLFSAEHKVTAVVAIIRDETTRFAEERALRERLAELEAQVAAAP